MKNLLSLSLVLLSILVHGQEQFTIQSGGLTPKLLTFPTNQTPNELYQATLAWAEENKEGFKLTIISTAEGEEIQLSSVKGNAVTQSDRYFHAKYDILILLTDGQYTFQPTQIQLKVNSKYDMGWKHFDLQDTSEYFKKGKVVRKYKDYLEDLVAPLNQLHSELTAHLKSR